MSLFHKAQHEKYIHDPGVIVNFKRKFMDFGMSGVTLVITSVKILVYIHSETVKNETNQKSNHQWKKKKKNQSSHSARLYKPYLVKKNQNKKKKKNNEALATRKT